jgi:hypothetical protein
VVIICVRRRDRPLSYTVFQMTWAFGLMDDMLQREALPEAVAKLSFCESNLQAMQPQKKGRGTRQSLIAHTLRPAWSRHTASRLQERRLRRQPWRLACCSRLPSLFPALFRCAVACSGARLRAISQKVARVIMQA